MTRIMEARIIFEQSKRSILFVTSQLRSRELKMAHGLRQLGSKIGLIYHNWTPFDPEEYFDFCFEVVSADEALQLAKQLRPQITHVFSGAIDDFILNFCRDKPSPVVIDLNDIFAPSLFDYCHERFEPTKEALLLADGFCARDLQVKIAEKKDGFQIPKKIIFFPEYCWGRSVGQINNSIKSSSDEIHVVSVGTFSLETQGMYDSCYLDLAKRFIDQNIHFHIYPHWMYREEHANSPHAIFERDFSDFIKLEKVSPFLHLHKSLPIDELEKVLPKYDFGVVSGGAPEFGQRLSFYYPAYIETCYSGRISDYLQARLPVLVNDEVKFNYWLLNRLGVCIDIKGILKPEFKKYLLKIKKSNVKQQKMQEVVKKFSVEAHAQRLSIFYDSIIYDRCLLRIYEIDKAVKEQCTNISSKRNNTFFRFIPHRIRRFIAKYFPPFREIKALESRLHISLEDHFRTLEEKKALESRLHISLEDHFRALEEKDIVQRQLAAFQQEAEAEKVRFTQQLHLLSNDKFSLQQERKLGNHDIHELAGMLNWTAVLDDVDRANGFGELMRILAIFSASPYIANNPSACWQALSVKNFDELLKGGYSNFKRTIGLNYFTFLIQNGDPQLLALENLLPKNMQERCREGFILGDNEFSKALEFPATYCYFVALLWEYAKSIDRAGLLAFIEEPKEGNPIMVSYGGVIANQDLANAVIEYYSMLEAVPFENLVNVLEIGGGYGRTAYALLRAHPQIRLVMVDILPALYIAQRYLSSVFRERKVFRVREFESYEEVASELEQCSIVFLTPYQLTSLPADYFHCGYNISSFGEMHPDQLYWYFDELARLIDGYFYCKQWKISNNVFDKSILAEGDYPYPASWTPIFSRQAKVQAEFFESLFRTQG